MPPCPTNIKLGESALNLLYTRTEELHKQRPYNTVNPLNHRESVTIWIDHVRKYLIPVEPVFVLEDNMSSRERKRLMLLMSSKMHLERN